MNNNNNNNNSSSSSSSSIFTTSTTTSRLWLLLVVVYLITSSRTIRNTHTTTKNHPTPTTIELKKTTQQKKTETTITTDDEYYQPSEYQYIYHLWLITCETRTNSIDLENWFWSVNVFANTTTTTDSRSDTTTGTTHTHTHHHHHHHDVIVHEPRNICHGKQWKSFLETKIRSVYEFVSTLTKFPIINLDDQKKQQQSQQEQQRQQEQQPQLQEEHLVIVIDDDVAINSFAVTPSDVIDRYYNILRESSRGGEETTYIKKMIVIGAETNCFVGYDCKYEQLVSLYPNTTRSSCPQFANGGSYMGPPDMLQQMTYTFLFEYNFTNGDYYGKINDDQSMLHSYHKSHSQHPQLTTTVLDTKASLFRSLMVGLINSELYKPPRKGGRVCGGLDPTQHKTCAYNQPPIWDIITTNTTEDDDDNDTTTITTTIHNNNNNMYMSSSLAKKKTMIQMYPHIPGCDYEIESVPFIIHGHGGSTYKKKVQEYVQRLQQQQQLQQQQK